MQREVVSKCSLHLMWAQGRDLMDARLHACPRLLQLNAHPEEGQGGKRRGWSPSGPLK